MINIIWAVQPLHYSYWRSMINCVDKECETETSTILHLLDSILSMCAFIVHIWIMITIIKQKRCSSLPFLLLLAASVAWAISWIIISVHSFMEYILNVPNAVCITTLFLAISATHCAVVIEFELFLAILYTLYQCYKLRPLLSEETTKKLFWRSVTVAVCVVVVINSSRVAVAFQEVNYSSNDGYCIALVNVSKVTPFTQYISIPLLIFLLVAEIVVLICIAFLFLVLLRNNSFTVTTKRYKCMKDIIRILIILVSSSVLSILIYYIAAAFDSDYCYATGAFAMICERCVILITLLKCQ